MAKHMSEGEFKKRIQEITTLEGLKRFYKKYPKQFHYTRTETEFVEQINSEVLDDAKKERPDYLKCLEYIKNQYPNQTEHEFEHMAAIYYRDKVIAWSIKWFGESP
jgi:hypothetical protein